MEYGQSFKENTSSSSDALASVWLSDNGDGTFTNGLLWGDYPDNDVIRVNDTYYMASTSMHLFPGCPIVSSHDLVHWHYESYALPYDQLVELANEGHCLDLKNGNVYDLGAWASSLRYNKKLKKFYLLVNIQDGTPEEYATLSVADSAFGPWKVYRLSQRLYDPGLFFEEDGTGYVVHGQGQLYLTRLRLVDEVTGEYEVDDTFVPKNTEGYYDKDFYNYDGGYYNEGSHVYKIDDVYYVLTTPTWDKTGTKKEICIQTKDLVNGPYEVRDIHSSFMNFGENGIHQGGIVDVPLEDGNFEWWSIIFQDRHKLGRTPTLQPVYWEEDENGLWWPMIGEKGKCGQQAVVTYKKPSVKSSVSAENEVIQYFDDFTSDTLDLCWQWNHVPDDTKWSLTERSGYLRLYTAAVTEDFSRAPNTLRQRVLGPESSAEIKLDISHMADGDIAGLAIHQKEYTYIGVKCDLASNQKVIVLNDNGCEQIRAAIPMETVDVWFRAHAVEMEYRVEYFYSLDGKNFVRLGGRYDMHYGYYVGMGFGAFNFAAKTLGGYVDLDSFAVNTYRRNRNYAAFGSKIEAENYDNQKYEVEPGKEPSRDYNLLTTWTGDFVYTNLLTKWGDAYDLAISNLRDGDWMQYNRIDFGEGAAWFNARVSGQASGGRFEVRLGEPDGRLLSTVEVPDTGDAETFINVFAEMDRTIMGIQKIFLVYRGPDTICRINWFMFGVGKEPKAPEMPEVNVRSIGDGQAEIRWEKVKDALTYDIRINDGTNEKIISNAESPFVETGLEAVCTVSVRAKNYGGYSEWSKR